MITKSGENSKELSIADLECVAIQVMWPLSRLKMGSIEHLGQTNFSVH